VSRAFLVDLADYQSVSFKSMSTSITIVVNGTEHQLPASANVRQLLIHLGVGPERIAVELNRRIIKRKEWDSTALGDHDKVEIVQFVGGG
jgi:thiamine biosynthesis protein ThiS